MNFDNFDPVLLIVFLFGGIIRQGTPYLFVSLGECITERSGRVNLGLEGTLFMGAMSGYGVSLMTGSPWLGVLFAGLVGIPMGALHAVLCNLPRVNFVAMGIAMMYFGIGLAKFLGKPLIHPKAEKLGDIDFGAIWCQIIGAEPQEYFPEQVRNALKVNQLFLIGLAITPLLAWMLTSTRWGMILRLAGESEEAAAAMGYSVNVIRIVATAAGGFLAGVAGSYMSLYYPGSWNEQISSGQGLMAVALVIFARWSPVRCLWASLLFGGASSLGLALQTQEMVSSYASYLWNTAPYVLTLVIMIITSSRSRAMAGAPGVLTAGH
jgi:general nucleoside transport system permease protein